MALAPFFDKAALAASHLLPGYDSEAFKRVLEAQVVGIIFDDDAVKTSEGKVTLELAVNLLARLYPRIAVAAWGDDSRREGMRLHELARAINPQIEIAETVDAATVCLAVGSSSGPADLPVTYMGSDGWIVGVSPNTPVGSGNSGNPLGACAAACFGAADVFRTVFSDQLQNMTSDAGWRSSLLDLGLDGDGLPNPDLQAVDIGESHLVGVGAIGNAFVWALARMPFLRGTLHLVDHEEVDTTNPQRYVLTDLTDVGASKVDIARQALADTHLTVYPHPLTWGQYLHQRADWNLERVAVALDTPEDRCAVQAALPRWIANAWTQPEDLGVSRHAFIDDQACLMCLYMPDKARPNMDEEIASALRLPADVKREIRSLLVNGNAVGPEWTERVASANGLPPKALADFQGLPMHAFYQRAVCGGMMLALGAPTERSQRTEVPMAFQSALAGVMLAAELIANASGIKEAPPPVTTKVNLLRPLGSYLSLPEPKHPSGRCICQDEYYQAAYRRKYD